MKKKRKIKISPILSLIYIIASLYLIFAILQYNNVENLIRYAICGVLIVIDIILLVLMKIGKKKKKKGLQIFTNILKVLFIIVFVVVGFNLNKIMGYFVKVNKVVTYSAAMVTLKENNDTDLSTLSGKKLGIIEDVNQVEGYQLAKEIINNHDLLKKNTLVTYSAYEGLIDALYKNEVDYIFLPAAYEDIYATNEEYEGIGDKVKTLTTSEKETTKEEAKLLGTGADITKPFTVLLMGIDSTTQGLKNSDSFNGDTLILVTFNPTTMTATMLSIHRDSYVPITCVSGQTENKINSAASKGTNCTISTIENYTGVKIDYYAKINFTGLVNLIDILGGIEVDVPYALCEQDSQRRFGSNMVYIEQGKQILNGEQALAFARNRKSYAGVCPDKYTTVYRSVELRGMNQQTVILQALEKAKQFNDISKIYDILDVVSDNVDTNMTKDTILSFYNVAKDMMLKSNSDKVIQVQKLNITGDGQMIYDEASRLVLWYFIPKKESLAVVKDAMLENLGQKSRSMIKTFSFNIDDGYTETIVGENVAGSYYKYPLLADFEGEQLKDVQDWANQNGVTLSITYVKNSSYANGTVISQEYPTSKRIDRIPNKTVKIEVVKNDDRVDCLTTPDNSACKLPSFIGKDIDYVENWASKFSNTISVDFKEKYKENATEGEIIEQSLKSGTTVKEMLDGNKTLIITTATKKKEEEPNGGGGGTTDPNPSTEPEPSGGGDETPGGNDSEGDE